MLNNQEILQLVIISFILMTLMFDSGVILKGEFRCWSLSGIKGLKKGFFNMITVNSWGYFKSEYSKQKIGLVYINIRNLYRFILPSLSAKSVHPHA